MPGQRQSPAQDTNRCWSTKSPCTDLHRPDSTARLALRTSPARRLPQGIHATGFRTGQVPRAAPPTATSSPSWVARRVGLGRLGGDTVEAAEGYDTLVIWMSGLRDVVVEIDSAPNAASAQKLAFARDAGAYPLWVRFGTGGIEKIDGVMVLDIREATRRVRGGKRLRQGQAPGRRSVTSLRPGAWRLPGPCGAGQGRGSGRPSRQPQGVRSPHTPTVRWAPAYRHTDLGTPQGRRDAARDHREAAA